MWKIAVGFLVYLIIMAFGWKFLIFLGGGILAWWMEQNKGAKP